MYLTTLSKHPHVNSDQLMITIYKSYCLIQSRIMTCASISGSTMSSLARDNLDTNIIAHDRNRIIMIPSGFPSCYVMYHGLH